MKKKIIIFLVLILLVAASYGGFLFWGILKENENAKTVLMESEKYAVLKKSLLEENNRCQVFITQEEGDFGSFEYCKKFIQWSKDLPLE